jgi:hypothetical protein
MWRVLSEIDRREGDSGEGEKGADPAEGDCDLSMWCRKSVPFDGDLESDLLISRIADCESKCRRCEGECIDKTPPSRCGEYVDTMRCCPPREPSHHLSLSHHRLGSHKHRNGSRSEHCCVGVE